MGKRFLSLTIFAAGLVFLQFATARAEEASPIGKKIESFSAKDFDGKEYRLADFADSNLSSWHSWAPSARWPSSTPRDWSSPGCRVQGPGVAFVGVDSNQQDSITELAHYARRHGIEFPRAERRRQRDRRPVRRGAHAGNLRAGSTTASVRYWGRVDDQFGFQGNGIAYQREEPQAPRSGRRPRRVARRQAGHRSRDAWPRVATSAASSSRWPTAKSRTRSTSPRSSTTIASPAIARVKSVPSR